MAEFRHDLGDLKAKMIVAGIGLSTLIILLLVTLRGILKPSPGAELAYLVPILGALVIVAVSSIILIALAFAPLVNSLYERIQTLQDLSQAAIEEGLTILTQMSDESQRNRELLEHTQQELENGRQSLAAMQPSDVASQETSTHAASNEERGSSSTDQITARVAQVLERTLGEITDRVARTDALYEQLVEQQASMAERLAQITSPSSTRQSSSKTAATQPKPQLRIQEALRAMSLERAWSIHSHRTIPNFTSLCEKYRIDPKSVKEHAWELFAKWNILSYRQVWQYDDEQDGWEILDFSEKMERLE